MQQLIRQPIRRVVVKVGSSTLTHTNGKLNLQHIQSLVTVLADMKNAGLDVVLVSSGAVSAGLGRLGLTERPDDSRRQAISSIGQCALIHLYDKLLSEYGHMVGQVLLTRNVFEHPVSRENAANTFERLFEYGALPIVNENDTISTYELEQIGAFGDNDQLSAYVAVLCKADLLILLSDIDVLYDRDPRLHADARPISVVRQVDDMLRAGAGGAGSARGTGGMATKLAAADIAMRSGIQMVITNGARPEEMLDICAGTLHGTLFIPESLEATEEQFHA